jgi:hypothetical protein
LKGDNQVPGWVLRLPDDLDRWIRKKAATETIKQNKRVSMNSLVVEILTRAMEAEKKKGE